LELRVHACVLIAQDAGAPTDSPTVPKPMLCPPPLRRAVGHARMSGAVGKSRHGLAAAENEICRVSMVLADRPAAVALAQFEQRATLRAAHRLGFDDRVVGDARRVGSNQAQCAPLRKNPGALGAGTGSLNPGGGGGGGCPPPPPPRHGSPRA
jgi:hypothetical protein